MHKKAGVHPVCTPAFLRLNQPARRSNQTPASAQIPAGISTASNGEKPNTSLDGRSRSWLILNTKPTSPPVNPRCPGVTERSGPKIKEIAISTSADVTSGCSTLVQNDNQY